MAGAIAGYIVTALGGAAALGTVGVALVNLGVGLVFSAVARALQKKPSSQEQPGIRSKYTGRGDTLPQTIMLGRYATGGHMIGPMYSHSRAPGTLGDTDFGAIGSGDFATFIINILDVPIEGLNALYVDGVRFQLDTHLTGTPHPHYGLTVTPDVDRDEWIGRVWLKVYDGSQTAADPYLRAAYGSHPDRPWKSTSWHRGGAYAIITVYRDTKLFRSDPQFRFEVNGMSLYDPRTEEFAFTDNPAVMVWNIMRGLTLPDGLTYGMGVAEADLPAAWWHAAMDLCDAPVAKSGGGTEAQYRAGIEIGMATPDDGGLDPLSAIDSLLPAMSAEVADLGGMWIIRAGGPGLSALSITDDDILNSREQSYQPLRGLADTHNAVAATFPNPDAKWESTEAPTRYDDDAIADDGDTLIASLDLNTTPYGDQVQRLQIAWLSDAQRRRVHALALPPYADQITVLDTLDLTSSRHGYASKTFEVQKYSVSMQTGVVNVVQREVDPDDFIVDEDAYLPQDVVHITRHVAPALALSSFDADKHQITDGTSDKKPAIRLTWTLPSENLDGVAWQVLRGGELVIEGSTVNAAAGEVILSEGILPNTGYSCRAKPIAEAQAVQWSSYVAVTTDDIRIVPEDLDTTVWERVEIDALDVIDTYDLEHQFTVRLRQIADGFDRINAAQLEGTLTALTAREGLNADIETERTTRITEDEALATDIISLTASLSTAEGTITANTGAINSLTTRVTTAEGTLTTQGTSIAGLQSDLSDAEAGIAGNSTAIDTVETRVTANEGDISTNASDVTQLESDLTSTNSNVSGNATAITGLTTRVTSAEGVNTSQGSSIAQLESDLSDAEADISGNATALSGLTTRVTSAEGTITTQGTSITQLETDLSDAETDVAGNASAISGLDTRVTSAEGAITSQGSSITSINSSLSTAQSDITSNTSGIAANASDIGDAEDRLDTTETDISGNASAISGLDTRVTSAEGTITSQGSSITSLNSSLSTVQSDVAANASDIGDVDDRVDGTVTDITSNATAVSGLDTRVTANEGDISSQAGSITSINSSLSTAQSDITANETDIGSLDTRVGATETDISGNASAISSLDTRVTSAEGDITSQGSSITSINSSLSTAQGDIAANASGIGDVDDRVDDAETDITGNASAISSLDTRVTSAEGGITSQASSIMSLDTRVGGNESSISSLSATKVDSSGALTAVEQAISADYASMSAMASDTTFAKATADGIEAGYVLRLNGAGVFEFVSVSDGTTGSKVTGKIASDYMQITGLTQMDQAVIEDLAVDTAFIAQLRVGDANIDGQLSASSISIDGITLDSDGSGNLIVKDGGIKTANIEDGAVSTRTMATEAYLTATSASYYYYFDISAGAVAAGELLYVAWSIDLARASTYYPSIKVERRVKKSGNWQTWEELYEQGGQNAPQTGDKSYGSGQLLTGNFEDVEYRMGAALFGSGTIPSSSSGYSTDAIFTVSRILK